MKTGSLEFYLFLANLVMGAFTLAHFLFYWFLLSLKNRVLNPAKDRLNCQNSGKCQHPQACQNLQHCRRFASTLQSLFYTWPEGISTVAEDSSKKEQTGVKLSLPPKQYEQKQSL